MSSSDEIDNLKYGTVPYSNILFKDYLNVPYNIPGEPNYYGEKSQYSNYVIGEEVFLERIPEDPSWIVQDENPYGISNEEYVRYEVDSTGTVEKFTKLKLRYIEGTQAYEYVTKPPESDNSINLLSDSLQFNYKSYEKGVVPYDYKLFINDDEKAKTNDVLLWLFNYKSGYVVFNCDNERFKNNVEGKDIKFTFVRYRGKKGADKFCVQYDNSNNVGIGTETPREKLEVSGNVIINGLANVSSVDINKKEIKAIQIEGGHRYSAAIFNDGTVKTTGVNYYGQMGLRDNKTNSYFYDNVNNIYNGSRPKQVACNFNHTAVLFNDGTVQTFGRNNYGQLGNGTNTNSNNPVDVSGIDAGSGAIQVAGGAFHTAVLFDNGTVKTIGRNVYGQLGIGTDISRSNVPVDVSGIGKGSGAIQVACGGNHTAVLFKDGTVKTFGYNGDGQLGNGTNTDSNVPVDVSGIGKGSGAIQVTCGTNHTAVLFEDGTVKTFGDNEDGELGIGTNTDINIPVDVSGIGPGSGAIQVDCGENHTAVLFNDGTIKTFGSNFSGQLGDGTNTDSNVPVDVSGIGPGSGAIQVSCGFYHTLILFEDGTIRGFGTNRSGELGIKTPTEVLTPQNDPPKILSTLIYGVNTYNNNVFYVDDNGTMYTQNIYENNVSLKDKYVNYKDLNNYAYLNDNINIGTIDIKIKALQIEGGYLYSAAIFNDGTVKTTGINEYIIRDDENNIYRTFYDNVINIYNGSVPKQVSTSYYHTLILFNDGTVQAFGNNEYGQLGDGTYTEERRTPVDVLGIGKDSGAIQVACGYFHSAVLFKDGTVKTFGRNNNGQLGLDFNISRSNVPVNLRDIGSGSGAIQVACSAFHTAVLFDDGTVKTIGRNVYGQLGHGDYFTKNFENVVVGVSSNSGAIQVACGGVHTAVLFKDGTVKTFGRNNYGQLGIGTDISRSNVPVDVSGIGTGSGAIQVACGDTHIAVLFEDGTVQTFGDNRYGQLGIGTDISKSNVPVDVSGIGPGSGAIQVACGTFHTLILFEDGTIRGFGTNRRGELGIQTQTDVLTPQTELPEIKSSSLIEVKNTKNNVIFDVNDSGNVIINGTLDMSNNHIINVGDPENDNDAVNKSWVETRLLGFTPTSEESYYVNSYLDTSLNYDSNNYVYDLSNHVTKLGTYNFFVSYPSIRKSTNQFRVQLFDISNEKVLYDSKNIDLQPGIDDIVTTGPTLVGIIEIAENVPTTIAVRVAGGQDASGFIFNDGMRRDFILYRIDRKIDIQRFESPSPLEFVLTEDLSTTYVPLRINDLSYSSIERIITQKMIANTITIQQTSAPTQSYDLSFIVNDSVVHSETIDVSNINIYNDISYGYYLSSLGKEIVLTQGDRLRIDIKPNSDDFVIPKTIVVNVTGRIFEPLNNSSNTLVTFSKRDIPTSSWELMNLEHQPLQQTWVLNTYQQLNGFYIRQIGSLAKNKSLHYDFILHVNDTSFGVYTIYPDKTIKNSRTMNYYINEPEDISLELLINFEKSIENHGSNPDYKLLQDTINYSSSIVNIGLYSGLTQYGNGLTTTKLSFDNNEWTFGVWLNISDITIEEQNDISISIISIPNINVKYKYSSVGSHNCIFEIDGYSENEEFTLTELFNEWNHISIVKDDTTLRLYINDLSATIQDYGEDISDGIIQFLPDRNNINVYYDDLRFYSRSLTDNEIENFLDISSGKCESYGLYTFNKPLGLPTFSNILLEVQSSPNKIGKDFLEVTLLRADVPDYIKTNRISTLSHGSAGDFLINGNLRVFGDIICNDENVNNDLRFIEIQNNKFQSYNNSIVLNNNFIIGNNPDQNNTLFVGLDTSGMSVTNEEVLDVDGNTSMYVKGNIETNGNITCESLTTNSDRRLKDNIKLIEPQEAYNIVSQLNGVRYSWKNDPESKKVGLIAQDVERILPEVVKDNYKGYKSVDYSSIVSVLCQSIKQLKNELEELKTEFNKFKSQ